MSLWKKREPRVKTPSPRHRLRQQCETFPLLPPLPLFRTQNLLTLLFKFRQRRQQRRPYQLRNPQKQRKKNSGKVLSRFLTHWSSVEIPGKAAISSHFLPWSKSLTVAAFPIARIMRPMEVTENRIAAAPPGATTSSKARKNAKSVKFSPLRFTLLFRMEHCLYNSRSRNSSSAATLLPVRTKRKQCRRRRHCLKIRTLPL